MSTPIILSKIDRNKLIVTQANKLAEASYTMTLEEKRVVLLLLSLVRRDDNDFKTYRIPITDIRDYLNLRTNKLYDDIKRVAESLLSRVLHIPEDGGGWLKVGWVSSARYVPKGYRGAEMACLDLSFSPEMKPYLLELKAHFSSYMLQNVAGLRSFYSIRLYEILKSRRRLKSVSFNMPALRKILKVETKYQNHKDFRIRVILVAQNELARKTDLAFNFQEQRRGRKVVGITFDIRDNVPETPPRSIIAQPEANLPTTANDNQPALLPPSQADIEHERLYREALAEGIQNGVRESVMLDLLASHDPLFVIENIELARKRHMTAKAKDANLAGLTISAITKDYAAEERAVRHEAEARSAAKLQARTEQVIDDEAREAARTTRRRLINAKLQALPKAKLKALRNAFAAEVKAGKQGTMLAASFKEKGWNAPGIDGLFRIFVAPRLGFAGEADNASNGTSTATN
ncbi:MAG: replication initiation protein [Rhodospirillales bacterium]|nr:replication initiation protein [Rhodospirillales bacterium]